MTFLQWCKTQILAILVMAYIEIIYTREGYSLIRLSRQSFCNKLFDFSLTAANFALIFDAVTACSVNMLDTVSRGFSYQNDALLDMRMDQRQEKTARDIINGYSEMELFHVIRDYGEERILRACFDAAAPGGDGG